MIKLTTFYLFLIVMFSCSPGNNNSSSTSTSNAPAPAPTPAPTPTIASAGIIHISGTITYDFIPENSGKLDYFAVTAKPMRNIYLELLNANDNSVIDSTSTSELGLYDFTIASSGNVKIRIYAEMKLPQVLIQDNTNSNAEYAILTSSFYVTDSLIKNIRATSGWSGSNTSGSYSGTRVSAPFAILDSIYTITSKVLANHPGLLFSLLKINWSVNNVGTPGDITLGQIGTSYFDPTKNQLYILGKADIDTDEFDTHVIVHEWGHYFEHNLSRSDSPGGNHGAGDVKDISLAFSEGFANALSAMGFDPDVYYSDTNGSRQQNGFQINIESSTDTHKGQYSETSIQEIIYDIYDSTNEVGDNLSLGLGPILDVLIGSFKTDSAATSIFSFIHGLKVLYPAIATDLNTLLAAKNIANITDSYGTGEMNDGGWNKNLPLYNPLSLGGGPVGIVLYGNFGLSDFYGLSNTAFNNKYLRFTASSSTTKLVVTSTDTFLLYVFKKGVEITYQSELKHSAGIFGPFTYNITTIPGEEYVIQLYSDQDFVLDNSLINLTVTATAL